MRETQNEHDKIDLEKQKLNFERDKFQHQLELDKATQAIELEERRHRLQLDRMKQEQDSRMWKMMFDLVKQKGGSLHYTASPASSSAQGDRNTRQDVAASALVALVAGENSVDDVVLPQQQQHNNSVIIVADTVKNTKRSLRKRS